MLAIFVFCLLLCACGGQKETSEAEENQLSIWDGGGSLATGERREITDPPETWPVTEGFSEMEKIEINPETDGNPYLSAVNICESEDAIFQTQFAGTANQIRLYRYDKDNHTYDVLCNRPDCTHDEGCVAFAEWGQCIKYYCGKIYAVAEEGERDYETETGTIEYVLYEIDPNGSSRRAVQTLVSVEFRIGDANTLNDPRFIIHRGYVYYWHTIGNNSDEYDTYRNGKNCIWRVPLGGEPSDAECVFVLSKKTLYFLDQHFHMKNMGSYIYFVDLDQTEGRNALMYRINTEEETVEKLPVLFPEYQYPEKFHINDQGVYWLVSDGRVTEESTAEGAEPLYSEVYCYQFATGTLEVVWRERRALYDYSVMYEDESYFYISRTMNTSEEKAWSILVFDKEFHQIDELELETYFKAWYGGSFDTILLINDNFNYAVGWADKSKIGTDAFVAHRIGE